MWTRRTARRLFWTRSTLRRTSDRIEAWLTLVLVLTMLLVAPGVGWWAGRSTYLHDVRSTAWERQHRFPVDAVLLDDAYGRSDDGGSGLPPPAPALTRARWTGPDGAVRTGMIFSGAAQHSGATVRIWVDDHGAVVARPVRRNAMVDAILVAVLAVSGLAVALCGVHGIVVWRLNRHRLRAWQDDWLLVEPRWTHR
jgi:hypothetical protein